MKKAICVFLLIILVCVLCFAFAACSQKTQKIELTYQNYSEYIAINSSWVRASSPSTASYELAKLTEYAWICYVRTARKQNVHFENVKITFSCGTKTTSAELDYDGNSECTFNDTTIYTSPPSKKATVNKISGYVIVS